MQFLAIVATSVLAAIAYGICHDQVTVRVCIEYFTIGHPKVIESESPTLLALTWGVLATWWVGLPLGILLGVAARVGERNKLTPRDLLPGIGFLLGTMALASLVSGLVAYKMALDGKLVLHSHLVDRVAPDRHSLFIADLWAHFAAYFVGALGGIALAIWTYVSRRLAC